VVVGLVVVNVGLADPQGIEDGGPGDPAEADVLSVQVGGLVEGDEELGLQPGGHHRWVAVAVVVAVVVVGGFQCHGDLSPVVESDAAVQLILSAG